MGGLVDWAILGSADHHMACAFIGEAYQSLPGWMEGGYMEMLMAFQDRCVRGFGRRLGYVRGNICHSWHGSKKRRLYRERWAILKDGEYDPTTDLHKDWQGVLCLTNEKPWLAEEISRYFRQRNEDGIDE